MSRSREGTLLTTRSLIRSTPSLMLLEPGDHAQGGRLPAPGGADEHHELAVVDLEIQTADRSRSVRVHLRHVLERDLGHREAVPGAAGLETPHYARTWSARTWSIVSASAARLVGAVALHAREAQRDAARVARARLHAVERDLDDELRAHVDDVPVAAGLELEQPLGLPREHRVGHALERLAEHHEAAGLGVARAEVEVREPALAAPVTPLGGEHDEVERVDGLDLEPAGAAPPAS